MYKVINTENRGSYTLVTIEGRQGRQYQAAVSQTASGRTVAFDILELGKYRSALAPSVHDAVYDLAVSGKNFL